MTESCRRCGRPRENGARRCACGAVFTAVPLPQSRSRPIILLAVYCSVLALLLLAAWISAPNRTRTDVSELRPQQDERVTTPRYLHGVMNIRAAPSVDSRVVRQVQTGDTVHLLPFEQGEWAGVVVGDSVIGFIHTESARLRRYPVQTRGGESLFGPCEARVAHVRRTHLGEQYEVGWTRRPPVTSVSFEFRGQDGRRTTYVFAWGGLYLNCEVVRWPLP